MIADNTSEWLTHQHRDTAAAIVGHPPLLAYISIADGECQARERFEVIEVRSSFLDLIRRSAWKRTVLIYNSACCNPAATLQPRRTTKASFSQSAFRYNDPHLLESLLVPTACCTTRMYYFQPRIRHADGLHRELVPACMQLVCMRDRPHYVYAI